MKLHFFALILLSGSSVLAAPLPDVITNGAGRATGITNLSFNSQLYDIDFHFLTSGSHYFTEYGGSLYGSEAAPNGLPFFGDPGNTLGLVNAIGTELAAAGLTIPHVADGANFSPVFFMPSHATGFSAGNFWHSALYVPSDFSFPSNFTTTTSPTMFASATLSSVPEPTSFVFLGIIGLALFLGRKRFHSDIPAA